MISFLSNKSPIIYMLTCKLNGKAYIGQSKKSLAKRFAQHKYDAINRPKGLLHHAIIEHGIENFEACVLYRTCDLDELNKAEVILIEEYNTRVNRVQYISRPVLEGKNDSS
jgi:group I intron endonuclease